MTEVEARDGEATRTVDLALGGTLLALCLVPIGNPVVRTLALLLAGAGLLFPAARRAPALWLALAGLAAIRVALDWPLSDNHAYLLAYWCLAIALSLHGPRPETDLAWHGRILIGVVFALASVWKLAQPEFLDGTFFRVTLLTDPRFEIVPRLLGGLDAEGLATLRGHLESHVDAPAPPWHSVPIPNAVDVFARIATAWTLGVEIALAIVFLLPPRLAPTRLAAARDLLLAGFCAATYLLAPVAGFAWLLLSMGLAQSGGRTWAVRLHLSVYGLVLVYHEAPFREWLLGL